MKLTQKIKLFCYPSFVSNTHTNRFYMCSLNVCGLASKLKYNIIQEYIGKFDIIYYIGVNSGLFQYCFKHKIRINRIVFRYNMSNIYEKRFY